MSFATDIREERDPDRDARRPYGDAQRTEQQMSALSSIGGESSLVADLPPIPGPKGGPPVPRLRALVAPGTPLPYAGPERPTDESSPREEDRGGFTPEGVGSAVGDVLGRFLRSGGAAVSRGLEDIVKGFPDALAHLNITTAAMTPVSLAQMALGVEGDARRGTEALAKPAGGLLGVVASPFIATAETARVTMVQAVPELRRLYERALSEAEPGKETEPGAVERERVTREASAAQQAIDAGRTALWNAAGDEGLSQETRLSALAASVLLGAESAGEFAAPSMAYRVPSVFRAINRWRLGRTLADADALAPAEANRLRLQTLDDYKADLGAEEDAALAQVEGGLTGRIGAKPEKVARPADANVGPAGAQNVARSALAKETAARGTPAAELQHGGDTFTIPGRDGVWEARGTAKDGLKVTRVDGEFATTKVQSAIIPESTAVNGVGHNIRNGKDIVDLATGKVVSSHANGREAQAALNALKASLVDPVIRRNLGDIVNERLRLAAVRSDVLNEAPIVVTSSDEQAILSGITATLESIAPQLEARTQNLGQVMQQTAKSAERQMFAALRRAVTQGEEFRMRNVTVGQDAEGKAVRLRQMVGSFDSAIETIQSTGERAGHGPQVAELLAPFFDARRAAMEALQAQEAYNAAIRRSAATASQGYREASKAATAARVAEKRAAAKAATAEKRVDGAEGKVSAAEGAQAERTQEQVQTLEQRIAAAKRQAEEASQSVRYRIGGDKVPQIAHVGVGYVTPDVAEVWARNRLHTGTFDDPLVGEAMAAYVKAHPGAIDNAEHSWQQFTSSISSLTGADIDRVQRSIPKTGELTRTMYVAEQVFGQLVKEWRATGKAVSEGAATEAQLSEKTGQVMAFEDALRRGIGEQGRGLGARNLVKKADAVQVIAANEKVRISYATVEKLAKKIDNLEGQVAAATASGDSARLTAAKARLETTVAELEAANITLAEARTASATAAESVYKAALRKAVAQGATKDTAAVLAKYDPTDIVSIAAYLRSLQPQGFGALVQRLATAGRYGKVPSQVLNAVGTGAYAFYKQAAIRPLTALTAPVVSRISGVKYIRAPEDVQAAWLGAWTNTPDASRFLARTFWDGSATEIALKHGVADYETLIGQGLESGSPIFRVFGRRIELTGPKALPLDASLRALYASDGFWRIMLGAGERDALAALDAFRAKKGMAGAVDAVARRETVRMFSLRETFNEPIKQGTAAAGFMKLISAGYGGFAPLRLLIPAARFGMNMSGIGLRQVGGGLVSGTAMAMKARNAALPLETRTAMARQGMNELAEGAVGASLLAVGFNLNAVGITTGPYPTDEAERNRWATLGIKPMSFKIGEHYIPMGWFGPLAAPFALSALIADAAKEQDDDALEDRIQRAAQGLGQYLFDQPAMYATKSLIDAITSAADTGSWEGVSNLVSQISVVTSLGALAQSMTPVFDPYERDPEGFIQRLFSRYPGTSTLVPARTDQRTGEPVKRAVSGVPAMFVGFGYGKARSEADLSPVERETLGVKIGDLGQTVTSGTASVKLSQDQYKAYEQNARQKANDAAAKVIETSVYKQNPDPAGRQAMLKAAYDRAATEAREELGISLVASAKTPEEVFNAAIISRATLPEYRYVLTVGSLISDGRLTTDIAEKVDDTRPRRPDGTAAPSVAELHTAAPLVRQYVAIRPFLRGGPTEWAQVRKEREEMSAIRSSKGDAAAGAYARAHPLVSMYADGAMTNPARKNFLDAHKSIKSLVGGSDWEWSK